MNHLNDDLTIEQKTVLARDNKFTAEWGNDASRWPEDEIRRALCRHYGYPFLDVSAGLVDVDLYREMSDACSAHGFLPTYRGGVALHVFMTAPFMASAVRLLRNLFHREIHPIGTTQIALDRALTRLDSAAALKAEGATTHLQPAPIEGELISWNYRPEEGLGFIERVLHEAYRRRGNDVFFESYPDRLEIRFKIGGKCDVMPPIDPRHKLKVINDAKAFAGLSLRDARGYRDGNAEMTMPDGNVVNVRAVVQRAHSGETLTLRLLDKKTVSQLSKTLPFPPAEAEVMRELIRQEEGIILVVGPTGSGKTTTLWRVLLSLDSSALKIVTIEDPVEYRFDGFIQLPVTRKKRGNDDELAETFPEALRSCLRAAPDKILVGEIRDRETAGVAVEASLTGHQIFSTLHAPTSTSAITRLLDLDVSPLNIRQSVLAIVAQRLRPKLCPCCRIAEPLTPRQVAHYKHHNIDPMPEKLYRENGCPQCGKTGRAGRVPVFEILVVDETMRGHITASFDDEAFRKVWVANGGKTLSKHALELARDGLISYDSAAQLDRDFAAMARS